MAQTKTDSADFESLLKNPLLFYIRKNKFSFALGMLFLVLTNALDVASPLYLKQGIDAISAELPFSSIIQICISYFAVMAGLSVTRYGWRIYFGRYHTLAAEDLRNRVFNHLTHLGPSYYQKNQIGEIMSLISNDIQAVRNGIGNAILILVDGFVLILMIVPLMLFLNPTWTWKTLIVLPLIPIAIKTLTKYIFRFYKAQQDEFSVLSGFTAELISGIRVIKTFVQEDQRLKMYNQLNSRYENASMRTVKVDSLFLPIMNVGVAFGSVILLVIAAQDLSQNIAASLGTLVAFQRYIVKMSWPVTALGFGISQFQKGMASFERIREVLKIKTENPDLGTTEVTEYNLLEVKNLSFTYPKSSIPALKDITFSVAKGQSLSIIGPVGSGKSTLLSLLVQMLPSPPKTIFINSLPIEEIRQQSLRSLFTLIPQDPFLFSASIAENVSFGRPDELSRNQVDDQLATVELTDEVSQLPQKIDAELGEKGVNLSGGQKQRLALARGLALDPKVLLLDDTLSAVDHTTEQRISSRLDQFRKMGMTQIVVTHRLSICQKTDFTIVMNQGEIEAMGTHDVLLEISPTYKKMNDLQGLMQNASEDASNDASYSPSQKPKGSGFFP